MLLVGCGGGSGEDEASGSSKATFIRRADAICSETDGRQKAAQSAFLKKYPEASSTKLWEEKLVLAAALPPVRVEAEELAKLTAPGGDEEEVDAIIAGLEEAVKRGEAEPSLLLTKGAGPFASLERRARAYGFKACALPL